MILLVSLALGVCLGSIGLLGEVSSIANVLLIMGAAARMVNIHTSAPGSCSGSMSRCAGELRACSC
jgi:hypothetical protein